MGTNAEPWASASDAFTRWRGGAAEAINELVRLLSPVLWQLARGAGLDREQTEDVVQSTWLALVDHAAEIERPEAVGGWLCTTTRRTAWRTARTSARTLAVGDDGFETRLPTQPGPDREVLLDDESRRLWTALDRLPERCQSLLRMVAAESRPDYNEVSRALGMPIGSIGPTRGRCLDKLRKELVAGGDL